MKLRMFGININIGTQGAWRMDKEADRRQVIDALGTRHEYYRCPNCGVYSSDKEVCTACKEPMK